ncbi:MAG: cell wall hydrolase [Clostridium sp.]|uniref:cell wall hydrolase n=1 Tax=Clostridium sp. TaxID=1506 RepID=UPI003D6CEDD8
MKNNGLSNDVIHSGQVLDVPTNTYNVVDRDTLFFIAKKYSISVQQLRVANDKWNNIIHPGDVIKIPTTTDNGQATPRDTSTVIKYSNSDVDLLARLITAEASGESSDAMLAVGAVVINRVQSSQFPGNISSVINEVSGGHYQFTPVKNGMINKVATKTATNAAYQALKGNDPTNGALYFFDNTVTNEWLTTKPVATTLGKLIFAY